MSKYTQSELDSKVLNFVRAKRNTNTYRVSQHFKIKWETAERSLKRLQAECKVFYEPEVKIWSIYTKLRVPRAKMGSQHSEKREISTNPTGTTFDISLSGIPLVRGQEGERLEKAGFVCHQKTKGNDVSDKFVRMHLNGQYLVKILKTGSMPESYADSETGITVGWYERKMNGNYGYFGRVGFPDDPKQFNIQSLGTKDKGLTTLGIYIHPRYIYYQECKLTASLEFRTQIQSVLNVLEAFGWEFGEIEQKGTLHFGLNNTVIPAQVPVNHVEKDGDPIHFDSSVKDGKDGFCTEAELYDDHPGVEEEVSFWIELPRRFDNLENSYGALKHDVDNLSQQIDHLGNGLLTLTDYVQRLSVELKRDAEETNKIADAVDKLVEITEFNTAVITGSTPIPSKEPIGYIAKTMKGDVMYG